MSPNSSYKHATSDGVLPAQLGIVLVRRPTIGHAAATLVSLAERGILTVTSSGKGEAPEDGGAEGWLLGRSQRSPEPGARFEAALLDGLPQASVPLPLTGDVAENLARGLRKFASELVKDAVHHGWLRHLHHDQLTPDGEELAERARKLRTELRHARASGEREVLASRLPCALVFGLVSPDSDLAAGLPLARFAAAFVSSCSDLPGWQAPDAGPQSRDVDTWSRNEWGGMPPGGRFIGVIGY